MSRFRSTFKKSALDQDDRKQGRINLMAKNRKDKRSYSFAAQRHVAEFDEEFNDFMEPAVTANNENKFSQQGRKGVYILYVVYSMYTVTVMYTHLVNKCPHAGPQYINSYAIICIAPGDCGHLL
jgi:hypothetical protein